jgi:thymidylate synthase (FAD)
MRVKFSEIKIDKIQHWGCDVMVVNAARVSFGKTIEKLHLRDKKLITYLARHKHYSPFEHLGMTLRIKCPLYIRSQIMRHRTFSYNEISRRYTEKGLEFYSPTTDDFRFQSSDNKQASEGAMDDHDALRCHTILKIGYQQALDQYERLLDLGLSREQARGILPQNLMTEFYMSGNLRNWCAFIALRDKPDAQKEAQIIAKECKYNIIMNFPISGSALLEE